MITPQIKQAMEYIANQGDSTRIDHFDEDHDPIGPSLRKQLKDAQLAHESEGVKLNLTIKQRP